MNEIINYLVNLPKSTKIGIASHVNPDGDNIASILSIYSYLKTFYDNVTVYSIDPCPDYLEFLPNTQFLCNDADDDITFDVFITLDCGDKNRLGKALTLFDGAKKTINIDHHISNPGYGDMNYIDSSATSTCQIVYQLLISAGYNLTKEIATCLYVGISTDTGHLMYDSVNASTFRIMADLVEHGIDAYSINMALYQSNSINKFKLMTEILNTATFEFNNQVAFITVSQEMLANTGTTLDDSEGVISFIRDINTVEIAVFIKELGDNIYKVSVRSKKYFNCAEFCQKFGGGGHIRAAGCTIIGNLFDITSDLKREIVVSLK